MEVKWCEDELKRRKEIRSNISKERLKIIDKIMKKTHKYSLNQLKSHSETMLDLILKELK